MRRGEGGRRKAPRALRPAALPGARGPAGLTRGSATAFPGPEAAAARRDGSSGGHAGPREFRGAEEEATHWGRAGLRLRRIVEAGARGRARRPSSTRGSLRSRHPASARGARASAGAARSPDAGAARSGGAELLRPGPPPAGAAGALRPIAGRQGRGPGGAGAGRGLPAPARGAIYGAEPVRPRLAQAGARGGQCRRLGLLVPFAEWSTEESRA